MVTPECRDDGRGTTCIMCYRKAICGRAGIEVNSVLQNNSSYNCSPNTTVKLYLPTLKLYDKKFGCRIDGETGESVFCGDVVINPTPQIEVNEGSDFQVSCFTSDPAATLILEINGVEVDPAMDTRLRVVDVNGVRTYTYSSVSCSDDNSTFQCFTSDRSRSSAISNLSVLSECQTSSTSNNIILVYSLVPAVVATLAVIILLLLAVYIVYKCRYKCCTTKGTRSPKVKLLNMPPPKLTEHSTRSDPEDPLFNHYTMTGADGIQSGDHISLPITCDGGLEDHIQDRETIHDRIRQPPSYGAAISGTNAASSSVSSRETGAGTDDESTDKYDTAITLETEAESSDTLIKPEWPYATTTQRISKSTYANTTSEVVFITPKLPKAMSTTPFLPKKVLYSEQQHGTEDGTRESDGPSVPPLHTSTPNPKRKNSDKEPDIKPSSSITGEGYLSGSPYPPEEGQAQQPDKKPDTSSPTTDTCENGEIALQNYRPITSHSTVARQDIHTVKIDTRPTQPQGDIGSFSSLKDAEAEVNERHEVSIEIYETDHPNPDVVAIPANDSAT